MEFLQKMVSGLGYDISEITGIEYHDPILAIDCTGGSCDGGCEVKCISCRDGNS